jgi:hypothetical protein
MAVYASFSGNRNRGAVGESFMSTIIDHGAEPAVVVLGDSLLADAAYKLFARQRK